MPTKPKRVGRLPKRAGSAYRPHVRKEALAESAKRQTVIDTVRAFAGTGLDPRDVVGANIEKKDLTPSLRPALPPRVPPPPPTLDKEPEVVPGPTANIRKVRYSLMMADAICQRLAEGEPLQQICANENMPTPGQTLAWLRKHPEFKEMYDVARELQADFLADKMLGLASAALADDPKEAVKYRVAADILTKQAEWRAPRKFGSKMQLEVSEAPKTSEQIKAEILQLEEDLGMRPAEKRVH
jgi:hypothetical protein